MLVLHSYSCETRRMIDAVTSPRPPTRTRPPEPPSAYVHPDVYDELKYNGKWRADQLAGGVLIGRRLRCEETNTEYVEVEGYVVGTHAVDVADIRRHFTSHWKAAAAAQRNHLPNGEIVGWYLSTGNESLDLDQETLLLHHTFFSHPWQVCLLLRGDSLDSLQADGDGLLRKSGGIIRD
jgi:hypothetical protein